jgi:glycosyltransferase involved in cell wall biosynthesis
MKLPLSIIIPTLNEEKYLPRLLVSLKNQTVHPKEIIIADAFSTDRTCEIAKLFGCKVVSGGLPAAGRNKGAQSASEELILFLDSDMVLPSDFLDAAVKEIKRRKLDVAACFGYPLTSTKLDDIVVDGMIFYLKLTEKFLPHGGAPCIFIKKSLHKKIKGFDESLVLAEDHDYVRRAAKVGKFSYLKNAKLLVSTRRYSKEGKWKLYAKYTISEIHQVLIGPIRKPIYKYEFGNFPELEEHKGHNKNNE